MSQSNEADVMLEEEEDFDISSMMGGNPSMGGTGAAQKKDFHFWDESEFEELSEEQLQQAAALLEYGKQAATAVGTGQVAKVSSVGKVKIKGHLIHDVRSAQTTMERAHLVIVEPFDYLSIPEKMGYISDDKQTLVLYVIEKIPIAGVDVSVSRTNNMAATNGAVVGASAAAANGGGGGNTSFQKKYNYLTCESDCIVLRVGQSVPISLSLQYGIGLRYAAGEEKVPNHSYVWVHDLQFVRKFVNSQHVSSSPPACYGNAESITAASSGANYRETVLCLADYDYSSYDLIAVNFGELKRDMGRQEEPAVSSSISITELPNGEEEGASTQDVVAASSSSSQAIVVSSGVPSESQVLLAKHPSVGVLGCKLFNLDSSAEKKMLWEVKHMLPQLVKTMMDTVYLIPMASSCVHGKGLKYLMDYSGDHLMCFSKPVPAVFEKKDNAQSNTPYVQYDQKGTPSIWLSYNQASIIKRDGGDYHLVQWAVKAYQEIACQLLGVYDTEYYKALAPVHALYQPYARMIVQMDVPTMSVMSANCNTEKQEKSMDVLAYARGVVNDIPRYLCEFCLPVPREKILAFTKQFIVNKCGLSLEVVEKEKMGSNFGNANKSGAVRLNFWNKSENDIGMKNLYESEVDVTSNYIKNHHFYFMTNIPPLTPEQSEKLYAHTSPENVTMILMRKDSSNDKHKRTATRCAEQLGITLPATPIVSVLFSVKNSIAERYDARYATTTTTEMEDESSTTTNRKRRHQERRAGSRKHAKVSE